MAKPCMSRLLVSRGAWGAEAYSFERTAATVCGTIMRQPAAAA